MPDRKKMHIVYLTLEEMEILARVVGFHSQSTKSNYRLGEDDEKIALSALEKLDALVEEQYQE